MSKHKQSWQGRKFTSRVQVCSASDRYLYRVHAEAALKMCQAGTARLADEDRKPAIERIVLNFVPHEFQRRGRPMPLTPRSYAPQRYVYRQQVGEGADRCGRATFAFRYLTDLDIELALQTLRDCFVGN